ncbi:hypothetical protein GC089_18125 [Cellulomonas sp. JZ18]|uniref:hypothetical protein n=1 Tax=Cellulomonas sp. JZ18 TaxID=2654191 RepID=UPI0012D3F6E7|nr:hypothetical protein [Cellulomonas sp. JZ18]QGQ20757.1 hypothetical protein GC089_18125 [Cellulomonas sp. JZ18]
MPAARDARRWGLALVVALVPALAGCNADDTVLTRAREGAEAGLGSQLARTLECLGNKGGRLPAAGADTTALAQELADCAGTTVLNADDEAVRTVDFLSIILGSVALSGEVVDGDLHLRMYTQESSVVQSGVTTGRVTLATCWQVTIDGTGELGQPSGVPCGDALLERARPTEEVPLDQVDVSRPTESVPR